MQSYDLEIQKEIVKNFFLKNKKERGMWLLEKHEKRELSCGIIDTLLDPKKTILVKEHYLEDSEIFLELSKITNNKKPYVIRYNFEGYLALEYLCKINMLKFQEVMVYFGKGIGYFQAHEEYGSRRRYILVNKNKGLTGS